MCVCGGGVFPINSRSRSLGMGLEPHRRQENSSVGPQTSRYQTDGWPRGRDVAPAAPSSGARSSKADLRDRGSLGDSRRGRDGHTCIWRDLGAGDPRKHAGGSRQGAGPPAGPRWPAEGLLGGSGLTQGEQGTSDGSTPLKQFNLTSQAASKPGGLVRRPELSIQLVLGRQGQQVFLWKEPGRGLQVRLWDT